MSAAPAGQHDVPLLVAGQVRLHTRRDGSQTRLRSEGQNLITRGRCAQPAECGQADARASLPGGAWSSATAAAPCGRQPSATCRLLSAACRLPSAGCRLSARPRDRAPDAAAWAQGDVLQAEGEPCEHMFCVADGEVRRFRKEGQSTVEVRRIADQHAVAHLPARPHADGHAGSGRHDVYVRHSALGAERALLRDGARNDRRQGVHSEQR